MTETYKFTEQGIELSSGETIEWKTINNESNKIKLKNKILIKFDYRYGRDDLYEYVITDKEEWEKLISKLTELGISETCLGEICGKHSEVWYSLDATPPTIITDMDEIIKFYSVDGYSDRNCGSYIIGSFHDRIYEETGE